MINFIIFDLEATCWNQPALMKRPQEIIEIGAVTMDAYGEIRDHFSSLVRPSLYPELSLYCEQLTGISTRETNKALLFPTVIDRFLEWINEEEDYVLCSWGHFDKKMLLQDCLLHGIPGDWAKTHLNLKKQFADIRKLSKPVGLKHALEMEGYTFEGNAHRALTDAKNLAVLFRHYLDNWQY